jgi:hypothetical protein
LKKKFLWIAAIAFALMIGLRFVLADRENRYEIKSFTPSIVIPNCVSYDSLEINEGASICMRLEFEVEFYSDYSRIAFLGTAQPGTDGPKEKPETITFYAISRSNSVNILPFLESGIKCQNSDCGGDLSGNQFAEKIHAQSITGYALSQQSFNFNLRRKYLKNADSLLVVLKFEGGKEIRRRINLKN